MGQMPVTTLTDVDASTPQVRLLPWDRLAPLDLGGQPLTSIVTTRNRLRAAGHGCTREKKNNDSNAITLPLIFVKLSLTAALAHITRP
eukprot:1159813-Pelagomonas_calceolata.AAC.6